MRRIENIEVAWILDEIADLLELKGESVFKIRAYRKAAKAVAYLATDLYQMISEKKLETVPGIGRAIAGKIEELLNTGSIKYYEDLKKEVPPGLVEIITIPGIGPKMAQELYQRLGITTVDELEAHARGRKLRELPGFGSKTEQNIIRGIEMMRIGVGRTTLGIANVLAESFVGFLRLLPGVEHVEVAGSTRRMKESIGDIDIVAGATEPQKVIEIFVKHPQVKNIISQGDAKASVVTLMGVQIDLIVVTPEQFWSALHHFTGSKEHNVRLRELAHQKGLKINEYGIFDRADGTPLPVSGEADIYTHLGLPYIPPEMREDLGEIEAAQEGKLPEPIEPADIKGDLHIHTDWSDGVNSIEQVAGKSMELGYQYIAVTDHSKSLGIARGLSEERLNMQEEYIRDLNKKMDKLEILSGIEVDILTNGDLDYPDEILARRDVVVASVHSGFRQDKDKLTARVISAMKNRHVDIVAHPTGRLIGRRDPYAIDMDEVLEAAAKYGTALEINSSPDRLDLNDKYVRKAGEMGVKISINTDAHEISRMEDIRFGVAQARRGWLTKESIINTMDLKELLKFLGGKR